MFRRILATCGVAAALVAATTTGAAALDGRISHVERAENGVIVAVDVPTTVGPDLENITATINGESYPATGARAADGDAVLERTTVIAIDTSQSMAGTRFQAAKAAATEFIDAVPADVAIGIVGFDSTVQTLLEPTTDRAAASAVVEGLSLSRQTLLYDGVIAAVDLASQQGGQGLVLVLSDGADTSSTPLTDVTDIVESTGILVDVVALEQNAQARAVLKQIAGPNGAVISADSGDLAAIFEAEAALLARQISVTIDAPSDVVAGQVSIEVTVPTSGGDVSAATTVNSVPGTRGAGGGGPLPPGPPPPPPPGPASRRFHLPRVGVFALGLLAAFAMLLPGKPMPMSAADRVSVYTRRTSGEPVEESRLDAQATLTQASDAVQQMLQRNQSLDQRIARRLEAAGSDLKSSEWLLLHGAIFVLATLIGLLLGGGNIAIGLVFMVIGAVAPWVYLGMRASRRRKKFDSLLPETLQLMSGSLSAGLSLMQSVDTIVREGADPVKSEFKRVLVETRLGVSLEDALEGVAERFDSRDFRWVVMAIKIQRQVGGNLAELLNTVAGTMREREYIRRQVGALAAEGKLSAVVLGGLPPVFLLYLTLAQRDYVAPLFNDVRGIIMLGGAALWLGVGIFWMSKLVKVEV
ncbi:type II secretion system F family protein [Nocardioides sp. R-C-SC26]|uniref:type II secretion system F family protein n=1 Tax=Nocardioides sp. R-C-SC26 TaxID=2870414 RepID=UPI001E2ADABA|nr:type II secretion system F family protein [Nocardioides sp. R-C-SC26]